MHEHTVSMWCRRFLDDRIEGLSSEFRPGWSTEDEQVVEATERTLTATPANSTFWSLRSLAKEAELSHTSIRRIWREFGL